MGRIGRRPTSKLSTPATRGTAEENKKMNPGSSMVELEPTLSVLKSG